ncbi:hypothetical protein AMS68_005518 [Peltaster fructicola]|uniref:Transaldolase n=1 Tax=Peltaster fructicola TaxID=286661 RepID=A0A6H0XZA5_9PEZI|nr:hypothetical protein AMS68_005518 [Peltaster fructicola]
MGVDTRRPPLPAPTDLTSMDETSPVATEVATNVTTRTDKTSYTIPEDGSPIIISTHKKESRIGSHGRQKSQTSLLIEYFEGSKTGDKTKGRPSVRVKVTPSSRKSSSNRANDAVQITSIGSDRKPSYTRRISLSSKNVETGAGTTELSHSSGSNLSGPPVEIEVLNNGSDLSRSSRGLMMAVNESNVSSMPPDSLLEGHADRDLHDMEHEDTVTKETFLAAPQRRPSRSTSRERITQKVMEKLGQTPVKHRKHESNEKRHRSTKSHHDDEFISGAESSLLSSNPVSSQRSYQSNNSQTSRVTNNAKLLEKVEDTIKRILLPEITAIREDQRAERKLRTFDSPRRGSDYEHSLERRVSKSSSSPNMKSKPKVVLNREGDDPGTVLSRGDSEYKKSRKSSGERTLTRRSSGPRKSDGYDEEVRHSSSKGELAAAGLAGAALTAAALKHHDSAESDLHHRRKRRSKSRSSRSRSNSIAEGVEEAYTRKETIPPMPMASHINDSDITRTSLISTDDGHVDEHRMHVEDARMPIREVSRGSVDAAMSPVSSRTPTRTPVGKTLGMTHNNKSIESPRSIKTRTAALASAGLAAAGAEAVAAHERHVDADGYGSSTTKRGTHSPAQSVSSLRMQYEEPLVPSGLRPHSAASRSSAERLQNKSAHRSTTSSPAARHALSRELTDEFVTPMERPRRDRSQTPSGEDVDEWFNREHLQNEQYRNSLDTATNRTSYQTNPYPEDEKRFVDYSRDTEAGAKDIQGVGANPEYVHTPVGVESAVASLIDPSTLSSARPSSYVDSPGKGTYSDRVAQQLRINGKSDVPMYEGSTLSQTMPSDDRWTALKNHAKALSNTSSTNVDALESPRQSPAKSLQGESPVKMVHSGLPFADDPMPEIGVYDDTKSEVSTNPSIIKGPLGGDATGQSTWPYTPSPRLVESKSHGATSGYSKDALLAGAVAGAGAAALASKRHATVDDDEYHDERKITPQLQEYHHDELDRNVTPTPDTPAALRDEGYVTDPAARTPTAEQQYSRADLSEYHRAMNAAGQDASDPFVADPRHVRHLSGNSHGMASPLYDSATGKGMENIQSKDIVALMDHLTVRDAQRNARDTEILVTLVRHAADMRQNFEDMKRFIYEQDELIMTNTKRGHEAVVQKVLSGPRPQPLGSPRTPRKQSEEDIQVKRRGLLRRALKGLTSGKSSGDLANIESMLVQVLDNVEQLKHQGPNSREITSSYFNDGMDSYERLRSVPDPGYDADGALETDSTPTQSGHFTTPGRLEKQTFHSGYNGRPGSENRVSTVMEGDEDEDLEPHERNVLDNQFENNERMLTPTQDFRPGHATSPTGKQYHETTPRGEKQQKHKSTNSSIFGVPKMSRWSKTTTSSAVPESPIITKIARPISAASRSGSSLREYDDDDEYSLQDDDRLRSTQSLAREHAKADARSIRSKASRLTRTPSPLIPSEASYRDDEYDRELSPVQHDDYDPDQNIDDPKYRAIRNSILLEHPQPRQGSTNRHQNNLESKAHSYDESMTESDVSQRSGSDFDPAQWGSSGVAALNKTRFSQAEPMSPVSMNSPYTGKKDNGPLVPSKVQPRPIHVEQDDYDDDEDDEELYEPQYGAGGFARNNNSQWYSSPLGSGHLLEPIAEVRYSLETDSGHISPEPQIASARAVTARKITGPRPMGSRSTSAAKPKEVETSGTVRRKPVANSRGVYGDRVVGAPANE